MTDYSRYGLSRTQTAGALAIGAVFSAVSAWLLFLHPIAAVCALPAGLLFPRFYRDRLLRKRKERLRLQFREMLQLLSSLLSAGRSVENAFLALESEFPALTGDPQSDMCREIKRFANGIRNGQALEPLWKDFASRAGLEEARSFADAFAVCKRAGGDLVEIVRRTSQLIGEKLDVEMELSVLMSQKRFESRIMMAMPFAFVGMLGLMAPDYLDPLREGSGRVLLMLCLSLLGACCFWINRIMRIEV